jgi:hypothetical protein
VLPPSAVSFFFNAASCVFASFSGRSGGRYFSCSFKGYVFVVIAEGWLEFLQGTMHEFAYGDILVEIDHDSFSHKGSPNLGGTFPHFNSEQRGGFVAVRGGVVATTP